MANIVHHNNSEDLSGESNIKRTVKDGAVIKKLAKNTTDKTPRQKKQKAINEDVSFRKLVENSYEGITLFNKDLKITYRSNSAKRITGWNTTNRKKNNIIDFTHPDDRDSVKAVFDDLLKKPGKSITCSFRSLHFKGHYLWLECIFTNLLKARGINAMVCNFRDITQRKDAELTANQLLIERNTILESVGDAFFAVDENWTVTYWNKTAEKVLYCSKEEMLGHNLWDKFADAIGSASYLKYNEALATQQSVHFEDHYPPLNKWYEISAYPTGTGLSVYFKDITERKLSDLQLNELNENLKKKARELAISNAELEQFAYVASHDLQEPLRMVTSFLTQLERKYHDIIDDKGKQYINFAVDGAKRMRQIILDLLEFSRVGGIAEDLEEVNLNNTVNEIINLYRKNIEDEGAKVILSHLPIFNTYKTPVRQVLQNLISNGLKYRKKNKPAIIEISAKERPQYWEISVKDNGIGIDQEYYSKIFIIFQQLNPKNEYPGTGMGLAIAKKIVENLGGRIWVESEEGIGSTFHFTILKNSNNEINQHSVN